MSKEEFLTYLYLYNLAAEPRPKGGGESTTTLFLQWLWKNRSQIAEADPAAAISYWPQYQALCLERRRGGHIKKGWVQLFYFHKSLYTNTSAFVTSDRFAAWVAEKRIDLRENAPANSLVWAEANFSDRPAIDIRTPEFRGIVFNGFGKGKIWIGVRPWEFEGVLREWNERDANVARGASPTAEERSAVLRSAVYYSVPAVATLPWVQRQTPANDLEEFFAQNPDRFYWFCRQLAGWSSNAAEGRGVLPLGHLDGTDRGVFDETGRVVFVYVPWTPAEQLSATLTITLAKAAQVLDAIEPGVVVLMTNCSFAPTCQSIAGLKDLPHFFRRAKILIWDWERLLAHASHWPQLVSEQVLSSSCVKVGYGAEMDRMRYLFCRESFLLRAYVERHPAATRLAVRGRGVRLAGRRGAGKSVTAMQLIQSQYPNATVFLAEPGPTLVDDFSRYASAIEDFCKKDWRCCLVLDDVHEWEPSQRRAVGTLVTSLVRRMVELDAVPFVIATYDSLSADAVNEDLFSSMFEPLGLEEIDLARPGKDFLRLLVSRYTEELQLNANKKQVESLVDIAFDQGGLPGDVAALFAEIQRSSLESVLSSVPRRPAFWREYYRGLAREFPPAARLFETCAFLRLAGVDAWPFSELRTLYGDAFGSATLDDPVRSLVARGDISYETGRTIGFPGVPRIDELGPDSSFSFDQLVRALTKPHWINEPGVLVVHRLFRPLADRCRWDLLSLLYDAYQQYLPRSEFTWEFAARLYSRTGQGAAALSLGEKYLQHWPTSIQIWKVINEEATLAGDRPTARAALRELLRGLRKLGLSLPATVIDYRVVAPDDVAEVTEGLIKEHPDDVELWRVLVRAHAERGDFESSSKAAQTLSSKVLGEELFPPILRRLRRESDHSDDSWWTLSGVGGLLTKVRSQRLLADFLALNGQEFLSLVQHACAAKRCGDDDGQRKALETLISLRPELRAAYSWPIRDLLGLLYKKDEWQNGISLFGQITDATSMTANDRLMQALFFLHHGDLARAEEQLDRMAEPSNELMSSRLIRGEIALRRDQYQLAQTLFSAVLESNPRNGLALAGRGLSRAWLAQDGGANAADALGDLLASLIVPLEFGVLKILLSGLAVLGETTLLVSVLRRSLMSREQLADAVRSVEHLLDQQQNLIGLKSLQMLLEGDL